MLWTKCRELHEEQSFVIIRIILLRVPIAQLVEQVSLKHLVVGSTPTGNSNFMLAKYTVENQMPDSKCKARACIFLKNDYGAVKISVTTEYAFPRWTYTTLFYIQPYEDAVQLTIFGEMSTKFIVQMEGQSLLSSLDHCSGVIRDYTPAKHLYALLHKLIEDHKRTNPSMLQ